MGVLTARVELFSRGLPELIQVLPEHYEELALHKDRVPLDPQFDIYIAREQMGGLIYVTLRDAEKLAGYYIGFIGPELHYKQTIENHQDIFYVIPEYRGMGGADILFRRVEEESRRRGVKRWYGNCKVHHEKHATILFMKMGFEKSGVQFVKWLGSD